MQDQQLQQLLRLPWTVVREITPEGELLLRIAEIPAAMGSGATPDEAEADLWASLEAALRAYLHFGDPVPVPAGGVPAWLQAGANPPATTPLIYQVPEGALTASSTPVLEA